MCAAIPARLAKATIAVPPSQQNSLSGVTTPPRTAAIEARSSFASTASVVAPCLSRATITGICSADRPRLLDVPPLLRDFRGRPDRLPLNRPTPSACRPPATPGTCAASETPSYNARRSVRRPALSGFLASRHPADEVGQRAFVDFMGRFADALAPKELHEQRGPFAIHGASFHQALALAFERRMDTPVAALTQSLAAFAQKRRDFTAAQRLFESLAEHVGALDNQEALAAAYHQLGRIAEARRDLASAEAWYQKSLAIKEKQGNEHGAAITYHQLGMIAERRRDLASAEAWYQKSLAIKEKQGDEHGAAITYPQLGRIAEGRRDLASAEAWYQKSLAIKEKQGDEHGAATTYHELGIIAQRVQSARERVRICALGSWGICANAWRLSRISPAAVRIGVISEKH